MNSPLDSIPHIRLARTRSCGRPQGFLYVAVLFTTLIVMVSVTAALSISTTTLRSETNRVGRDEALRLAESEIQRLAAMMSQDTQWRIDATNDAFTDWYSPTVDGVASDHREVRYRLADVDDDLTDDPFDIVELTVHARVHRSEVAIRVEMETDPKPLNLLDYALSANDDLRLESGGALSCERPVQLVDDCKTSSYGFLTTPQLECNGRMEITLRGDRTTSNVELPAYDVVDRYVSVGTEISRLAIPRVGGILTIQDVVLSSTSSPYGDVDAAGIYWIDAQSTKVAISNCRIDATLAILNATEVEISGGVVWHYPKNPDVILATNAFVTFTNVDASLSETDRGVNFNPPSTPYRQTFSNSSAIDTFPTELRGILYTSDSMQFDPTTTNATLRIVGCVIGYDIRVDGSVAIGQFDEAIRTPPLGLLDPVPRRFIRGTARRIPSPQ
ncbi:MAG: hypothetical protein ACR2NZ_02930 [Rubripirellula sp.]